MKKNDIIKKIKPALKETVETVVFVIIMVIIIKFFIGEVRWIPSGSMHPTLVEGDRIFVDRFSRFYREPERGDIMVFYPPMTKLESNPIKVFKRLTGIKCSDIAFIKRIVGMPGDKVEIKKLKDGAFQVLINDKPLKENYIQSRYDYIDCSEQMYCGPMVVPDGEYFMMGDNRGNSQDSRFWGFLPKERIIGRAVLLIWPFERVTLF